MGNVCEHIAEQTNGMLDNCLTATHGTHSQIIINKIGVGERETQKNHFLCPSTKSFQLKHVASLSRLRAQKQMLIRKPHKQLNNVGLFIANEGGDGSRLECLFALSGMKMIQGDDLYLLTTFFQKDFIMRSNERGKI